MATQTAGLRSCLADTDLRRYPVVVPHLAENESLSEAVSAFRYASNLSMPVKYQTVMALSIPFGVLLSGKRRQKLSMKENEEIVALRRRRLQEIIDLKFDGKQSKVVSDTGINQGELSGLLNRKSFGEKKARSLEAMLGLPSMYLDQTGNEVPGGDIELIDALNLFVSAYRSMSDKGMKFMSDTIKTLPDTYPRLERRTSDVATIKDRRKQ